MRTVWKYTVDVARGANIPHVLRVPTDAKFLTATPRPLVVNSTEIEVHAEVETDNPLEDRGVYLMETGKAIPSGQLDYLATVRLLGSYVIHVYARPWHIRPDPASEVR